MDYSYIDKLLERYWQGETSVEEEEMLRTFFRQRELPSRFEPYRRLFAYEDVAASEHLGAEFDERMLRMIEPGEQHVVRARHISVAARLRPFLKAAASEAVVLTIGGAIEHSFRNENAATPDFNYATYKDTYKDPQVAAEKVSSSLRDMSEELQRQQSADSARAIGKDKSVQ